LENTNTSLTARISELERSEAELKQVTTELRKELTERERLQKSFEAEQIANAQMIAEQLSSHTAISASLQSRLDKVETHDNRITALENISATDTAKLTEKITELENNEVETQLKLQNLESADVFLQEAHRMLMDKSTNMELEVKQMDINFDQLRTSMENKIQMNLQRIEKNSTTSQKNTETINSIMMNQTSISEQLSQLSSTHTESWTSVNSFMTQQSNSMNEMTALMNVDKQKMETLESEVKEFEQNFSKFEAKLEETDGNVSRNSNNIKEIVNKVTSQGNRMEEWESDTFSARERTNKINESIESINNTIKVFEKHHIETVEKLKEVTVLSSNTQIMVRDQEQKLVEQSTNNIDEVKKKMQIMDNEVGLTGMKIKELVEGSQNIMEKLLQLEDGHMSQLQKVTLIDRLGERVNRLDELRQQSEAAAKDEVDATMSKNREYMERLEKQIQETVSIQTEKIPVVDSLQSKLNQIEEEQARIEQARREELRATVEGNAEAIRILRTEIEGRLNEIKQRQQQEGEVLQNALVSLDQNLKMTEERFISTEETLQSTAITYQTALEDRFGKLSEDQQKQGQLREVMQNALLSLDQNLKMAEERFTTTEEELRNSALGVHNNLDMRLSQLSETVERLKEDEETLKNRLQQQEEATQDAAVSHQELLEGKLRDLAEETKMNSRLLEEVEPLAKGIDARLTSFDNLSSERLVQLREAITSENLHRFDSLRTEMTSSITSLHKEVQISITKLVEDNSGNQADILEKFRNDINALLGDVQMGLNAKLATLSEDSDIQRQKLDKSELLLGTLIERLHGMDETDERLTERVTRLEEHDQQLGGKFKNLEDADEILQEGHKQQTEKTIRIEEECKRIEETFVQFYKEQRQEIDTHIKENITKLQSTEKAILEKQDSLEKNITIQDGRLNDMEKINQTANESLVGDIKTQIEKLEKTTRDRTTDIENTLITYYEKVNSNTDDIKKVNTELTTLGVLTHDNINDIQSSLTDTENTLKNTIPNQIHSMEEKITNIEDGLKQFKDEKDVMNVNMANIEKNVNKVNDSMSKIMEQTNATLINDAQQDSKIKGIEVNFKNLETKLSSLEAADLYLQESFKQLTDRTIRMETDSQKIEANLLDRVKEQRELIEVKLQPQLNGLRQDITSIHQEHDNVIDRMDEITNKFRESDSSANEKIKEAIQGYTERLNELDTHQIKQDNQLSEISQKIINNENGLKNTNNLLEKIDNNYDNIGATVQQVSQKTKDNESKIKDLNSKIAGFDTDLTEKIRENEKYIQNIVSSLETETRNNSQQVFNLQESINIQSENFKRVDNERQMSANKTKDDIEEQLANFEDVIDKKINSGIMPKIDHLDNLFVNLEKYTQQFKEENILLKADTMELKKNGDSLKEKLANYEDVIDMKINTGIMPRIEHLDNLVNDFGKDVETGIASNTKAIGQLKKEVGELIVEKIKPTEDKVNRMENIIQGVNKTLALFEDRHVETVEKMKEVTLLTNNIQVQVNEQEQRMVEQSINNKNQIKDQLSDIVNQTDLTDQKIKELDSGYQTLQEKILRMDNQMADKLDDLAQVDASLHAKINGIESSNDISLRQLASDIEKLKPSEDKLNEINDQVQVLQKTITIFESHHSETVEKFKEIFVITNNIQTQMKDQEKMMVKQSASDLNQIREQLQDIEVRTGNFNQEIELVKKEVNNITDNLEEQLANFEDAIDKKINSDIIPRIEHLENVVSDIGKETKQSREVNEQLETDTMELKKNQVSLREQLANYEDVMDKKINTDIMPRIEHIDNEVVNIEKDIETRVASNIKSINDLKNYVAEMNVTVNNIQVQVNAQEQKMMEQSADELNQIKDRLRDFENQTGLSDQKIKQLDLGNQTLQERVLQIENQVADKLEDLSKTDASLLAKINGIESNNKADIQTLSEYIDGSNLFGSCSLERRLSEVDTGSQQLLEKLLEVEKEVEGKLSDNTSSLQSRLSSLEAEHKNNTLQLVSLQESINIQSDEVKKMEAEMQKNASREKEDLEARVSFIESAITDIRNELDDKLAQKLKPTEDKLNGIDGQVQTLNKTVTVFESRHVETLEKIQEITVITNNIQTQVKAQEQKMVEQSANDLNLLKEQLQEIDNRTHTFSQEINVMKNDTQNLVSNLEEQLANFGDEMDKKINSDILPRIADVEKDAQKINNDIMPRISDVEKETQKINNDIMPRIIHIDNVVGDLEKDVVSGVESNAKAINDLKFEIIESVSDKMKPTEDKVKKIDDTIQEVNKTLAIFDNRHVETVEKIKEVTIITNNIQTQVNSQEQKIEEQSTNDLFVTLIVAFCNCTIFFYFVVNISCQKK
jgi:chromosome segregation ATPase